MRLATCFAFDLNLGVFDMATVFKTDFLGAKTCPLCPKFAKLCLCLGLNFSSLTFSDFSPFFSCPTFPIRDLKINEDNFLLFKTTYSQAGDRTQCALPSGLSIIKSKMDEFRIIYMAHDLNLARKVKRTHKLTTCFNFFISFSRNLNRKKLFI